VVKSIVTIIKQRQIHLLYYRAGQIDAGGDKMKRLIIIIMFSLVTLTGCSLSENESSNSYPSSVAWNNILFGISTEEVSVQDIGKEIGTIKKIRSPMPLKNGESNDIPVGSLIFEVNGKNVNEFIAVKVKDKYLSATILGPLE